MHVSPVNTLNTRGVVGTRIAKTFFDVGGTIFTFPAIGTDANEITRMIDTASYNIPHSESTTPHSLCSESTTFHSISRVTAQILTVNKS